MPRNINKRINFGEFNEATFIETFKVPKIIVNRIHDKIRRNLDPFFKDNIKLTAMQKILLCLNFLGSGSFQRCIGRQHGIHKSTVCRNLHVVCQLIVENFYYEEIQFPPNREIANVKQKFSQLCGMPPLIVGCIDGSLININGPKEQEHQFVDRHGNHSINLSAICGPNNIIYWANVNFPGSVSDSRVLRESRLFDLMLNELILPPDSVFLGDSAYPALPFLVPPLVRDPGSRAEQKFLKAHRSTRQVIERTFGMLKRQFPCLLHLRYAPDKACIIIKTCVILFNMRRRLALLETESLDNSSNDENESISSGDTNIEPMSNREIRRKAEIMRARFIQHFNQ